MKDQTGGKEDVIMIIVQCMVNGVDGVCLLLVTRHVEEVLKHVTDYVTLLRPTMAVMHAKDQRMVQITVILKRVL